MSKRSHRRASRRVKSHRMGCQWTGKGRLNALETATEFGIRFAREEERARLKRTGMLNVPRTGMISLPVGDPTYSVPWNAGLVKRMGGSIVEFPDAG